VPRLERGGQIGHAPHRARPSLHAGFSYTQFEWTARTSSATPPVVDYANAFSVGAGIRIQMPWRGPRFRVSILADLDIGRMSEWRETCSEASAAATSQPANQPANQPASQPTSQPTNQPANQPTSQLASQPANQERESVQRTHAPGGALPDSCACARRSPYRPATADGRKRTPSCHHLER
jgi:hypothetical protein